MTQVHMVIRGQWSLYLIHVEIIDLCYLSTIMLAAQIHLLTKLSEHLIGLGKSPL